MEDAAADTILAARRAKRVLEPLGAAAPADPAAGYAIQRRVAERLGAVPPAGFKIGATTKQMQEYLGLSGPAAGFVPRESLRPDGATLRFADFLQRRRRVRGRRPPRPRPAARPLHPRAGRRRRGGGPSRPSRWWRSATPPTSPPSARRP